MTQQPTQPTPIRSLDDEVSRYLDLTEQIEQLTSELSSVKERLAGRGVGKHTTAAGVTVTVTAPPRRFNAEKAWSMLTEEQRAVCVGPDQTKVKQQLSQVLVDACMEEGTGAPRVSVR